MRVHQFVQGFSYGDATSNMALKIQALLGRMGVRESLIYAPLSTTAPTETHRCLDYRLARPSADDVLIYHFGTASQLSGHLAGIPGRLVLMYHNVTPSCYFRAVAPERVAVLDQARDELAALRGRVQLACGISDFNLDLLARLGYERRMVFPAWIDADALALPPDQAVFARYAEPAVNILFVGRVAPNKKIEDLIRLFSCLRAGFQPRKAKLFVAGSYAGVESYYCYLLSLCKELGLRDVNFTGHLSQAALNAYYRMAHAFVCTSEHEGFCIPLLEAAHFGLPVFAFDIPGVRETLGGTGVLWTRRNLPLAAESVAAVLGNEPLRADLLARQRARLRDFDESRVRERLRSLLDRAAGVEGANSAFDSARDLR